MKTFMISIRDARNNAQANDLPEYNDKLAYKIDSIISKHDYDGDIQNGIELNKKELEAIEDECDNNDIKYCELHQSETFTRKYGLLFFI